jgi:threonine dehydratase
MNASTAQSVSLITLSDIRAAAATLAGVAVRTPLLPADELGAGVWLKPEMLQRGGAFKFRGAYTYLAGLSPAERGRGVVAPSSGNHAQAVAMAARLFGVPATVVMPTTVTPAKRAGAERLGARVVLEGTTTQDRMERALELVRDEGMTLVPPYDHPTIVAGQGTAGLEIAEEMPDVETVLVPVGGGGLSAGVATAVKLLAPGGAPPRPRAPPRPGRRYASRRRAGWPTASSRCRSGRCRSRTTRRTSTTSCSWTTRCSRARCASSSTA